MKKIKLTPEEEMKLDMLRDSIQRYENLLAWQKLRRAEKKLLEIQNCHNSRFKMIHDMCVCVAPCLDQQKIILCVGFPLFSIVLWHV